MIKIISLGNELKRFDDEKSSLSLLVDVDGKKILFDAGMEDEVLENSKKVGVDLDAVDTVVLSHGHIDHTGGLRYLDKSKKIIAHPGVFEKKLFDGKDIGCPVSKEEFSDITLTKEPYELLDGQVVFLGEIPRKEEVKAIGTLENGEPDTLVDDSAIVIKSKNGLVVVFGCAHSGVINTIEYVKEKFPGEEFAAIVGGFHVIDDENKLREILKCFEDNKIVDVYPMHCLGTEEFKVLEKLDSKKVNSLETVYLGY